MLRVSRQVGLAQNFKASGPEMPIEGEGFFDVHAPHNGEAGAVERRPRA